MRNLREIQTDLQRLSRSLFGVGPTTPKSSTCDPAEVFKEISEISKLYEIVMDKAKDQYGEWSSDMDQLFWAIEGMAKKYGDMSGKMEYVDIPEPPYHSSAAQCPNFHHGLETHMKCARCACDNSKR